MVDDIVLEYADPSSVLERLRVNAYQTDPEIRELYDRALEHFNAYNEFVDGDDMVSLHNAGYELECAVGWLDIAEFHIQQRDKPDLSGLSEDDLLE